MDKLEEALKTILIDEEIRLSKKITCDCGKHQCNRCQPLCTHRQREERRLLSEERAN